MKPIIQNKVYSTLPYLEDNKELRDFIHIFSKTATGFHMQVKLFGLSF